jgi:hypothetical protein
VAALVGRFGLDNVQRVLDQRRADAASRHPNHRGGGGDGDDDEDEAPWLEEAHSRVGSPAAAARCPPSPERRRTASLTATAARGSGDEAAAASDRDRFSNVLRVGDSVQWGQADDDLPEGSIGEVRGGGDGGRGDSRVLRQLR